MTTPMPISTPADRFRRGAAAGLIVYWLALFIGTHVPRVPQAISEVASDKILHYLAYGGLAFLIATYANCRWRITSRGLLKLFAIVAIYGAVDELLQHFVGRHADILDWRADLLGCASGLAAFVLLRAIVETWLWRRNARRPTS